ncbi:MAG: hypothetical protein R3F54_28675 [Alphaproteobacteria bacterium]
MADLYKLYLKAVLTGGSNVDLLTGNVKVALIDTADYTVNLSTDEFLDDIPGAAIVATTGNLSSKGFNALAFDAADASISTVSGDTVEALVGYIDTGVAGTSRLVWYDDSISTLTPNGTDVNVIFNASGIFSIPAGNLFAQTLKAGMSGTAIDILTSNVKIVAVDAADYTANLSNDDFLADIAAGARVATSANLANKTFTTTSFDADNISISGVSGDQFEEVIGYIDSGAEGTSRLVWRMTSGTGLPFTPNSGQIDFTFNGSGIFTL